MFNSEINDLRELLMDGIRRSNTSVLAIWTGLSFDERSFSYDNEILTFDGNLANNFEQISGNPPNQAIFSYLERLYKDIGMFVGIDIQNILWQANQTAFQTEVQREASQKRVNCWLTNRDLAYERFADLYKDALQTYFPRKDAEWLYPIIETEDEVYEEKNNKKWEKKGKFRKKKGNHMLNVTPESLRGDIYVDAHTNTTATTINAVDKEQKMQFMNAAWSMAQWYAMAKQAGYDIEKILPYNQTMRDLASDFNIQPQDNESNEEVQWAKKKLMDDLMAMKRWQPQQGQPQQPLAPNPAEWQPQSMWWLASPNLT